MIGRHMTSEYGRLLEDIAVAAREAGEAILEIVRRGFDVEHKQDSSPVPKPTVRPS
jgi:3'(2'), 5'-bisphosphate nucleotidase